MTHYEELTKYILNNGDNNEYLFVGNHVQSSLYENDLHLQSMCRSLLAALRHFAVGNIRSINSYSDSFFDFECTFYSPSFMFSITEKSNGCKVLEYGALLVKKPLYYPPVNNPPGYQTSTAWIPSMKKMITVMKPLTKQNNWKEEGRCPQCGELGAFISLQMTCSKHGGY